MKMNNTIKATILSLFLGTAALSSVAAQSNSYYTANADMIDDLHKNRLKDLSQKGAFKALDAANKQNLASNHKTYFAQNTNYDVLRFVEGDIFLNDEQDAAFVVYHKTQNRVAIILFNKASNQYGELYDRYKVNNNLENINTGYGYQGTLDYVLGTSLVNGATMLADDPTIYLNREPLKITNIAADGAFNLKQGTFAKGVNKKNIQSSLCIDLDLTDFSYECLQFNPSTNQFDVFYGVAK